MPGTGVSSRSDIIEGQRGRRDFLTLLTVKSSSIRKSVVLTILSVIFRQESAINHALNRSTVDRFIDHIFGKWEQSSRFVERKPEYAVQRFARGLAFSFFYISTMIFDKQENEQHDNQHDRTHPHSGHRNLRQRQRKSKTGEGNSRSSYHTCKHILQNDDKKYTSFLFLSQDFVFPARVGCSVSTKGKCTVLLFFSYIR